MPSVPAGVWELSTGSTAIILGQIVLDNLGVGIVDRRAHHLDHFVDLSVPGRCIEKRGIHRDVGQAMTDLAVGFGFVGAGTGLELDCLLGAGHCRKRESRFLA